MKKLTSPTNIPHTPRRGMLLSLTLLLLLLSSCSGTNTTATETGYPDGEVQWAQIMYDGKIYHTQAEWVTELPYGFEFVGSVESIDNLNPPDTDFEASRLDVGDSVYYNKSYPDRLYIQINDRYCKFKLQ